MRRWSEEHGVELKHWERQQRRVQDDNEDKDNYDKGMVTGTRQLRGQRRRNAMRGRKRSEDTTKPTRMEAD